ncbi:MAG: hypothetical protein ABII22_05750 [Candidatus Micrarchaeota archaeon]
MVEIHRTIKCSNCSKDLNLSINTEVGVTELVFHGKCSYCGNSLQLNFSVIGSDDKNSSSSSSSTDDIAPVSIDDHLFEPEFPSDAIKDLID